MTEIKRGKDRKKNGQKDMVTEAVWSWTEKKKKTRKRVGQWGPVPTRVKEKNQTVHLVKKWKGCKKNQVPQSWEYPRKGGVGMVQTVFSRGAKKAADAPQGT